MNAVVCSKRRRGCDTPVLEIGLTHFNDDGSQMSSAQLIVESNDPRVPELTIPIVATATGCLRPVPRIAVDLFAPCAGTTVGVSAYPSTDGNNGNDIVRYEWVWLHTPGAEPQISGRLSEDASFVADEPGIHILGLHLHNNCGQSTIAPGIQYLDVLSTDSPFCSP